MELKILLFPCRFLHLVRSAAGLDLSYVHLLCLLLVHDLVLEYSQTASAAGSAKLQQRRRFPQAKTVLQWLPPFF